MDEEEELLNIVESTQLVDTGYGFAIYIDMDIPASQDFTIVPIYHEFDDAIILEIWIEYSGSGASPLRFALLDEVDEHVEAVGKWLLNGKMLLLFKDKLVSLPLPPNVKPMRLFAHIAGPDEHTTA
ncbi:MAG: hypothetical protein RXO22_10050 [Thermocladium sp.]|jgi:hypothetical protein